MSQKNSELKDRIRVSRQALGLSQQNVADKLGVTKSAVGSWEAGKHIPTVPMLKELSTLLNAQFEWLVSDETYISDDWLETEFDKNSEFKDRLKAVRKYRNLTQKELAEKLGLSTPAIAAWEGGRNHPKPGMLKQISEIMDCPYKWLVSDEVVVTKKWRERLLDEHPEETDSENDGRRVVENASKASVRITKLAIERKLTQYDVQMINALLDVIEQKE